jgi:excisionase family DNA binding protein
MTPNDDPTELLTIEEVAGRLKVKEKTVRDWIGRGELDAYKIGKEWRVRRDHLERHIEARRVGAQPAATGGLWDPDSATYRRRSPCPGHCDQSHERHGPRWQ